MDRACAAGAAELGPVLLEGLRSAVLAHRQDDGGFCGRSGGSDTWYTAFALRDLELTGGIPEAVANAVVVWLLRQPSPSTVRASLDHATIAELTRNTGLRRPCPPASAGSYDLFAQAVTADLLGLPVPKPDLSRLRRGLGFAESPQHSLAQVPATAAAITAQLLAGVRDRSACSYLLGQQTGEGGMRVHADIPVADLLSTATATWALATSRQLHRADRAGLARFAVACRNSAGFGAVPGDPQSDPEYIWYGLTTLALLRRHAAAGPLGWLRRQGWFPP